MFCVWEKYKSMREDKVMKKRVNKSEIKGKKKRKIRKVP